MKIRVATPQDYPEIYQLVKQAFKTAQVSDGKEEDFVAELRKSPDFIPELEFVAEDEGKLIGHVLLTKREIKKAAGMKEVLLLAPLCVAFAYRNQGIGGELMETAFDAAVNLQHEAVFLVGNPEYYRKYGFQQAQEFQVAAADFPQEFLLGRELIPAALKDTAGQLRI